MPDRNYAYAVTVEPLPEEVGGGFVATVPDLPGCMSDGATPTEALLNAQDAIQQWVDQADAMHRPIPNPTRQRLYG